MSYICVFAGLYPVLASLYVLYYKQLPLPTQKYLGETGEIAIFQKFYLPNRQFRCTQHDESPLFHSLSSFFQSRLLQQWAHQSVLKFSTKKAIWSNRVLVCLNGRNQGCCFFLQFDHKKSLFIIVPNYHHKMHKYKNSLLICQIIVKVKCMCQSCKVPTTNIFSVLSATSFCWQ